MLRDRFLLYLFLELSKISYLESINIAILIFLATIPYNYVVSYNMRCSSSLLAYPLGKH